MGTTRIEWADAVWNPVTGCTPVSAGCAHCYARRMAARLRGRYGYSQQDPFAVTEHWDRVAEPSGWCAPRRVFVCSMGDLFHDRVSDDLIQEVYSVMGYSFRHTYIVLTKRPEAIVPRLYEERGWMSYYAGGDLVPNVWHLTSVELQEIAAPRIEALLRLREHAPWPVLGVSVEPMLGPLDLRPWLAKLQWVICGAETGPGRRPMDPAWALDLHDQCEAAGVPFFFKRDGAGERMLHGELHEAWPARVPL